MDETSVKDALQKYDKVKEVSITTHMCTCTYIHVYVYILHAFMYMYVHTYLLAVAVPTNPSHPMTSSSFEIRAFDILVAKQQLTNIHICT